MNWTEEIPSLTIEKLENGNLRLEDKSYGDGAVVDVHPCQLRLMAEKLGLVPELSASASELLRIERQRSMRTIAELERLVPWLEMLEARCSQLHENVLGIAEAGHEEVNIEIAQSAALADISEQIRKDAQAALARTMAAEYLPCSGAESDASSCGTNPLLSAPHLGRELRSILENPVVFQGSTVGANTGDQKGAA